MKWLEKVRFIFFVWRTDIKSLFGKIKRRIWNKHILLRWRRLWIRENEFHSSLDMDPMAMLEMNKKERERYLADLARRRNIAHQKDFAKF